MSGHGGNVRELARRAGRPVEDLLDLSASINPLGPPEWLRAVVSRNVERLVHYPDPASADLVRAVADAYRLPPECVVVGNGSTEILHALCRAVLLGPSAPNVNEKSFSSSPLSLREGSGGGSTAAGSNCLPLPAPGFQPWPRPSPFQGEGGAPFQPVGRARVRAVIPAPAYSDYEAAARLAGLSVCTVRLQESEGFAIDWDELARELRGDELVILGQPNNPTGLLFSRDEFCRLAAAHPATIFVVDEAFADFVAGYDTLAREDLANVIVLRSLTKFYAIPGLRLGCALGPAALAGMIRAQIPPWSVNALAQAVGVAALADADYAARTLAYVEEQREVLARELAALPGLFVYRGAANFLLVRVGRGDLDAHQIAARLLDDGIAIRTFTPDQHLDRRFFRVAVRTAQENEKLVERLSVLLGAGRALRKRRRTAAIMFQGTGSNAGKSVLTAAFCRILLQDGVRVAPFKSQNMSLNSFVTRDGGEMGRAQVVQAQACRLEPDVRMNPILLKPNSDTGCQVIVRGRPVGNMRVGEYVGYKPNAFAAAKECFDSLAGEFDAVVLEGAGSPGEVNLKGHDIVNMRMAEYAAAPVLIVGDIDRGGVFASFVGTMEVLAEPERALVAGWVVNKFRGEAGLLGAALDYTLKHTGRPVLGVVPYLAALNLPQEDSVDFKSGALDRARAMSGNPGAASEDHGVEIAVIDLPHISNFTDFDAFAVEPDVRVRIVRGASDLGAPDAVILPGSKNTLGDLDYLRKSGLGQKIACLVAERKTEVVGICGGFQMLGRRIADPHGIESPNGQAEGLALLAVDTVLAADKTLLRAEATHGPSGLKVVGYEIHHGQTETSGLTPVLLKTDGRACGAAGSDGRVWGTYLHGLFDADEFRRWFIDRLRARRGLPVVGATSRYDIEPTLDRLADAVRKSLDMNAIYRLLRL